MQSNEGGIWRQPSAQSQQVPQPQQISSEWLRQLQAQHSDQAQQQQQPSAAAGPRPDSGMQHSSSSIPHRGGLSLDDPLATATLVFHPSPDPPPQQAAAAGRALASAAGQRRQLYPQQQQQYSDQHPHQQQYLHHQQPYQHQPQQQAVGYGSLHESQRQALLQLRQRLAAAAARQQREQQQLLQAEQQQQQQHVSHSQQQQQPQSQGQLRALLPQLPFTQQAPALPLKAGHPQQQQQQPHLLPSRQPSLASVGHGTPPGVQAGAGGQAQQTAVGQQYDATVGGTSATQGQLLQGAIGRSAAALDHPQSAMGPVGREQGLGPALHGSLSWSDGSQHHSGRAAGQLGGQQEGAVPQEEEQAWPPLGPVLEVESTLLQREGERVVSALGGGPPERAWALNGLCLLSCRQDLHLTATPGLLTALLMVLQEGLMAAVGASSSYGAAQVPAKRGTWAADADDRREAEGLPPLPGWQARRAERAAAHLFPDLDCLEAGLAEAAAAAVVLRNAGEVGANAAVLLDPPVMRCWSWALDAARELVQQRVGASRRQEGEREAPGRTSGDTQEGGSNGGGLKESTSMGDGGRKSSDNGSSAVGKGSTAPIDVLRGGTVRYVIGCGTAADIATSLLQLAVVLSSRMLLPAFFQCGMLLLRSLLILLRPTWQHGGGLAGGALLPPPLVTLATQAVAAVATAYQPNTDILLSMTGGHGGQPGATLMQVVADLLACPFEVFRQHAQQEADEESPDWRQLLPMDCQLLAEAKRPGSRRGGAGADGTASTSPVAGISGGTGQDSRSTAELCTVDMLGVLSQLRYLSALLHLLWRLLTASGPAGVQARTAAAGCPRLLAALLEVAVHRWPEPPAQWRAGDKARRNPDAYAAYLRFLSHDLMPAMRERQELLQPLRGDAAALLALLAADPETRHSVAWCEGQLATAVMLGVVPASEPGVCALLARYAAQHGGTATTEQQSIPPPSHMPYPAAAADHVHGAAAVRA